MPYVKTVVQFIADHVRSYYNNANNPQAKPGSNRIIYDDLQELVKFWMPSGSGIDCGTQIVIGASNPTKLHFTFDYHHMNQHGFYCGWTSHGLIVCADFDDFTMQIIGQHRSKKKHETQIFHDYLYDTFRHALLETYNYTIDEERKLRVYTSCNRPNLVTTIPAYWLHEEPVNA
jgi:hypothetical protein